MPTFAFTFLLHLLGHAAPLSHLRIDLVLTGDRLPKELKTVAIQEATAIWAAYDVDIHEAAGEKAARGDGAIKLAVAFVPRPARNVAADALGSIYFVNGFPTAAIMLYPNTIASLMPPSMMFGPGVHERSPFAYDRMVGRATGRALAHEIGHYLLRSRGHSAAGLMRARPLMAEMIEMNRHGFALADGDRRRLMSLMPEHSRTYDRGVPASEELTFRDVLAPRDCGVVR
jgi:hypothetical protein